MLSLDIQVYENKSRLHKSTEDMQIDTDGYVGQHQDYVVISGLLALWIWPHGVYIPHNLWWEPCILFLFPDEYCVCRIRYSPPSGK